MRSRNAGLNMQGKKDATSMRNRNALEGKKARKGKTKAYPQRIRARIRSAEAGFWHHFVGAKEWMPASKDGRQHTGMQRWTPAHLASNEELNVLHLVVE